MADFSLKGDSGGSGAAGGFVPSSVRESFNQQPQLGYGKQTEASIDSVNQWMRSTPWYQQLMQQWGQDPGHPTLSKEQSAQILRQAQANGVVVDQGNMEIDNHGNFNPKGHKLRNTLIVGGIAAATLATMGAAGAFAGGAGAAGGGLGGVEAGAVSGLGSAALPGAGTALGGISGGTLASAGLGSGLGAAALPGAGTSLPGFGGAAAAAGGAWDEAGNFTGPSSYGSGPSGGDDGGSLGKVAGAIGKDSFAKQIASALSAVAGAGVGKMIGGGGSGQSNIPPELSQLLQMSLQQQQDQTPLRRAVNSGAYQMLPTFAKDGAGNT